MVLKLCGGLWTSGRADEELDARQRRLQELLRSGRPSSHRQLFAKEVRLVVDTERPLGLELSAATSVDAAYKCVVFRVDGGQVAQHNARCKAEGDYARVVLEGMSVRCVDGQDVRGMDFVDVVDRIHTLDDGGGSITFADTSSTPVSPKPKLRTVGNIVVATQRAKRQAGHGDKGTTPLSPSSRRSAANANSSPKISKWSSVLTAVAETHTRDQQADALASDLIHKSSHLEAQVLILKGRVASLERERELEGENATTEMNTLLHTLQQEREEAQRQLKQLDETTATCQQLQREKDALQAEATTAQATVDTLQHQVDVATLHMNELRAEHNDVQHHAEELHSRLVATQVRHHEMAEELASLKEEKQAELAAVDAIEGLGRKPSMSSTQIVDADTDSRVIALLKRVARERDGLQAKLTEQQIELSCHEATVQAQSERLIELEEKLRAVQQINSSLKEQLVLIHTSRPQETTNADMSRPQAPTCVDSFIRPHEPTTVDGNSLKQQLEAERKSRERLEKALQALEDSAREKLQVHEKEQLFLCQFKEQLAKGITVTKYGSRGNPHPRILYTDPQCRWISWRSVDASTASAASPPRADAKLETIDLVEVLHGATTETFQLKPPEVPARCLSLVACHPCRTLDLEVENRDRALVLLRGFRLLLDEATQKRRQLEEN